MMSPTCRVLHVRKVHLSRIVSYQDRMWTGQRRPHVDPQDVVTRQAHVIARYNRTFIPSSYCYVLRELRPPRNTSIKRPATASKEMIQVPLFQVFVKPVLSFFFFQMKKESQGEKRNSKDCY